MYRALAGRAHPDRQAEGEAQEADGQGGGNMLQQEKTRYVDFTYLSFPYLVAKFNPPSEPRKRN